MTNTLYHRQSACGPTYRVSRRLNACSREEGEPPFPVQALVVEAAVLRHDDKATVLQSAECLAHGVSSRACPSSLPSVGRLTLKCVLSLMMREPIGANMRVLAAFGF